MIQKLINIQNKMKAPKSQFNKFGKYKYRNCEDILEAAKPFLFEQGCIILLTDELVMIGERYYIKATATLKSKDGEISTIAYAREEETKKGMDASQITGASSSYARKYALNGLLAIDDTKDSDNTNSGADDKPESVLEKIKECKSTDDVNKLYKSVPKDDQKKYKDDFIKRGTGLRIDIINKLLLTVKPESTEKELSGIDEVISQVKDLNKRKEAILNFQSVLSNARLDYEIKSTPF